MSTTLVAVLGFGGCADCRPADVQPLLVACDGSAFRGELHLDTAATFRSFLRDRCIPQASDAEIDAFVGQVDFTVDAVFVAAGARAGVSRCIAEREAESVEVCNDGLRISFADVTTADATCGGDWTVAFAMPRSELRAALASSTGSSADTGADVEG